MPHINVNETTAEVVEQQVSVDVGSFPITVEALTDIISVEVDGEIITVDLIESPVELSVTAIDSSVVEIGIPGIQGPPGPSATNSDEAKILADTYLAGQTISALRVVRASSNTEVVYATNNSTFENAQAIGIALNSGLFGSDIKVQFFGAVFDSFFNFPINAPIFLGTNGNISSSPGTPGQYNMRIGKSLGPGGIFIDLEEPILI
jgi:hypothetical protein